MQVKSLAKRILQKNRAIFKFAKKAHQTIAYARYSFKESLLNNFDWILPHGKIPPRKLRLHTGPPEYLTVGKAWVQQFVVHSKLKPHEKVLDVGCGVGRIAAALTSYLDHTGLYEGFDMYAEGVRWCQKHISSRFPNFHFQIADIYNGVYNNGGKCRANEYKFPFDDETFDFVFLISVFTHILPQDVEHYFSEIARVLKKSGRCFITFFLLNDESRELMGRKESVFNFNHKGDGYQTINQVEPESAVAYEEKNIRIICEKTGFDIVPPVHYGYWCGRKGTMLQDFIVAQKRAPTKKR
jgi:SAM-dependent methyltransferase